MKGLPHYYNIKVNGSPEGNLDVSAEDLPSLTVAPPKEFDGPGNQWSPEELLMASVANCIVLSFRAISKLSKLDWISIECLSQGELDRVDGKTLFTKINSKVTLIVLSADDEDKAVKLLNKAEKSCFVSNSLSTKTSLECEIVVDG